MGRIIQATIERYEHEHPMDFPKSNDPRLEPFYQQMREQGLIDEEGKSLAVFTLMRGCGPGGFLLRVDVDEEKTKQLQEQHAKLHDSGLQERDQVRHHLGRQDQG